MARVLTGSHAEDVGGIIVEPGGEIPSDADLEVLERLEADGRLGDADVEPQQTKKGAK
jgi:hypothetical protein